MSTKTGNSGGRKGFDGSMAFGRNDDPWKDRSTAVARGIIIVLLPTDDILCGLAIHTEAGRPLPRRFVLVYGVRSAEKVKKDTFLGLGRRREATRKMKHEKLSRR